VHLDISSFVASYQALVFSEDIEVVLYNVISLEKILSRPSCLALLPLFNTL